MRGNGGINWNVASSDRTVFEEAKKKKKKERDQTPSLAFVFTGRARAAETGRGSMYVCRVPVRWGIFSLPPPTLAHLWSRPSFEVTLREGRGIKAKQKSQQVHVALELTKSAICIIYSLNCSNARRWRDLWVPDNPSGLTNAIKRAPSPHLFLITACGAKTWEHLNACEVIYLNINSSR